MSKTDFYPPRVQSLDQHCPEEMSYICTGHDMTMFGYWALEMWLIWLGNWFFSNLILINFNLNFSIKIRMWNISLIFFISSWAPRAHTCNPSYLGGWDWEDCSSRPAQANSLRDPHLQNNQTKMDWRYGSSSKYPLCKCEVLSSNPSPTYILYVWNGNILGVLS
jgi:hypothetical protein